MKHLQICLQLLLLLNTIKATQCLYCLDSLCVSCVHPVVMNCQALEWLQYFSCGHRHIYFKSSEFLCDCIQEREIHLGSVELFNSLESMAVLRCCSTMQVCGGTFLFLPWPGGTVGMLIPASFAFSMAFWNMVLNSSSDLEFFTVPSTPSVTV